MNRSFNSPLGKSPLFSPRPRQSLTSKKILPQSFRKSSRFSVSGKSTQSVQIILSSPYNFVERFGQPLPVLITEALTFTDRNTTVSARISNLGYAWVVSGRRLFIWQYRQTPIHPETTPRKTNLLNQCFELQLPQSDLAHRAELVSVFHNSTDPSSHSPACIAVSPAGVVRYWPAIIHEELSVEENVKLDGQECDSLVDVEGLGCILATTTSTILLVQPLQIAGRHSLTCTGMKIPSGWLGGLGKRMSSLIFGGISSAQHTETGIVRVLSVPKRKDSSSVFVLAERSLQKWKLLNSSQELVFYTELSSLVRDSFRNAVWDNCESEIDLFFLDIQADKDNVIILSAAVNLIMSPRVHYALVYLQTNTEQAPQSVKDFLLLKMTDLFREEESCEALSYRFLLCGTYAYLYNHRSITVIKPHEEPDVLEFNNASDLILAGAICVNTPVFFSKNHGLVSVASNEHNLTDLNLSSNNQNDSFNESILMNNLSIYNLDAEDLQKEQPGVSQLKMAFILHTQNQDAFKTILAEHFPNTKLAGVDSTLDKSSLALFRELLDDIPANDPRWKGTGEIGVGSSNAMQVLSQLKAKQTAAMLFIQFLKETGLWQRLSASTIRNSLAATVYILAEMNEKIVAATVLKSHSHSLCKSLEVAVEKCVKSGGKSAENGLSSQDLFFREVTQVQRGLQELVNYCEDVCHSSMAPGQVVEVLSESNDALLNVVKEVLKYRKQNSESFKPDERVLAIAPDFLPWTAANSSDGLFQSFSQMHFLTYNYGVLLTQNNERVRSELLDQLVDLTDIILDGRKSHLESIRGSSSEDVLYRQYCSDRQKYMKPYIQEKEWERAAKLAEKYLDFDTLVLLCDATENPRRLDEYLERFSTQGFSEHVYNWYLKENKQGKLIDKCRRQTSKSENIAKLTNFLTDHPSLSWMQNIFDKNYNTAAETLLKLAKHETESITRQKTMLSLSKLAKLASNSKEPEESCSFLVDVGTRLDLIAFQEDIPDYVLQQYGYDTVNIRVIQARDLIELYICEEFKESGEVEFKKALDLLSFVSDEEEEQHELFLKIWRCAVLKDTWNEKNLDSPLDILQNKLFFRLIELSLTLDGNVNVLGLLPAVEELLDCDSLQELRGNANFQFLIRAGYEHAYKSHD